MKISSVIADILQIINRSHSDLQNLLTDDHTQYLDVAGVRPPSNIKSGTDATKPATPDVGDIYLATDTNQLLVCNTNNTWTEKGESISVMTKALKAVSDVLQWSNNTQKSTNSTIYVKLKEIKLNEDLALCRIKFDLAGGENINLAVWGRIYKNGTAIGTERKQYTTPATYSEDFTNFLKDDLIQIYCKSIDQYHNATPSNMRFHFDAEIQTISDRVLITPLPITNWFNINPTNQDP